MSRESHYIPVQNVNDFSDTVAFGELGLPVGMDADRLVVNLDRLEQIAKLGQIGHLTVRGFRGNTTDYAYGVSGMSADGIGTATRSIAVTKANIADADTERKDDLPNGYRWADATVKINNAEIEERIKNDGDRWDMGLIDPYARAKYMNSALKKGVRTATYDATFPFGAPLEITGFLSIGLGLNYLIFKGLLGYEHETSLALTAANTALDSPIKEIWHRFIRQKDLPEIQWSVFTSPKLDRYLASRALLETTKLFKVADH